MHLEHRSSLPTSFIKPVSALTVLSTLLLSPAANALRPLNEFVRHYEPLSYKPMAVEMNHGRSKRSSHLSHGRVHIEFDAYGRHFHLSLTKDRSSFSDDFVMETASQGRVEANLDHIYSGRVVDEPGSHVSGFILDGVFYGRITTSKDIYYVERANNYIKGAKDFHSIMYTAKDVTFSGAGCGVNQPGPTDKIGWRRRRRRLRRSRRFVEPVHVKDKPRFLANAISTGKTLNNVDNIKATTEKATETLPSGDPDAKKVCNMEIAVDHTLYELFLYDFGEPLRARDMISGIVSSHMSSASEILRNTNFGGITGITLDAERVHINDSNSCEGRMVDSNPFCSNSLDASYMLSEFSKIDHGNFCLAYVWTYRVFPDRLLGLAYVASDGNPGGICEKYVPIQHTVYRKPHYRRWSLNTGLITFSSQNNHVPERISQLSFAHEIGHNFGAQHDPQQCSPAGDVGNYIMYPRSTLGDRPNNRKYSSCSIHQISRVLRHMYYGRSRRPLCFKKSQGPICGNNVQEEGEDCDCGYDETECKDRCCFPRESKQNNSRGCTFRSKAKCSPSNSPCCTVDCKFHASTHICRNEDDCNWEAYCDGRTAKCPPSTTKADGTLCNFGTQLCHMGVCEVSLCEMYKMKPCYLSGPHWEPQEMCLIACNNSRGECKPVCEYDKMSNHCGKLLEPGSACNNLMGYCDVFHVCRPIDTEGPLYRLNRIIFGSGLLRNWLLRKWYITLLLVAFLCTLMATFIRVCAVRTPTSMPRAKVNYTRLKP
ncbi:disintegrin and metalloproteinase domain-containing protein 10-like isoform X1 [Ornithodoros turicata]|uniref:disintegrin and metalloproteinase domain-containing protein 10-like isoform X1 n=1 Tax=Ornithodoros turicata TaxID=34597 RepID=UPI0031396D51